MSGTEFRKRRNLAGIPGHMISTRARVNRAKLCGFERGYIVLSPEEVRRIQEALVQLIEAKEKVTAAAAQCGWPASAL
jgi:hypothetical protein